MKRTTRNHFFMPSRLFFSIILATALSAISFAQGADAAADSAAEHQSRLQKFMDKVDKALTVSLYVDAYYAFYTDSLGPGDYQKFPSVSPRSNQFGLNVAHLMFHYETDKARAHFALHYGDIQRSAWAGNVMEAQVGVRLCKKLWVDAGMFRTHVGAEGLMPKENLASSIAIPTYFEPYFQAGVRLNYNPHEKVALYLFALNGYNIYEDNNSKKSFGALVTYALSDKGNIGYSNYIGDDTPKHADSVSHCKVYQNVFFNYQVKKLKIQVGTDVAVQKNSDISEPDKSAVMFSGLASLKYGACSKFFIYARGEFFQDPQGFMSGVMTDKTGKSTGLKIYGATLGVEYDPTDNTYVRLEGRQLMADKDQEIFYWDEEYRAWRFETMLHMGVSF